VDQAVANIRSREDCSPSSVSVVGHTDTSGNQAYNQRLSQQRATVVANSLSSRGIPSSIISTDARGEDDLAKETRDGVREPLNRRSEVSIIVR
jgi:outer membrane protein OmpA-like peptidoglycan-associated protein